MGEIGVKRAQKIKFKRIVSKIEFKWNGTKEAKKWKKEKKMNKQTLI